MLSRPTFSEACMVSSIVLIVGSRSVSLTVSFAAVSLLAITKTPCLISRGPISIRMGTPCNIDSHNNVRDHYVQNSLQPCLRKHSKIITEIRQLPRKTRQNKLEFMHIRNIQAF